VFTIALGLGTNGFAKPVGSPLVFRWLPVGFPVGLPLVSCWFFIKFPLVPVGSRWFPLVPVGFEVKGFRFTYIGRIKTQQKSLKNQFYVSLSLVC
jgi:hypothetical protein